MNLGRIYWITLCFAVMPMGHTQGADRETDGDSEPQQDARVSVVGRNGMPKDIVPRGAKWNFGAGALHSFNGWQYAAYGHGWLDLRDRPAG